MERTTVERAGIIVAGTLAGIMAIAAAGSFGLSKQKDYHQDLQEMTAGNPPLKALNFFITIY